VHAIFHRFEGATIDDEAQHETEAPPTAEAHAAETQPAAASRARRRPRSRRRATITFYIGEALRDRARAAYRSTSHVEQDASWSEMLAKALLAEVERRESEHNDGDRFAGDPGPLRPGRPISY
jgi:hypothetical protein